MRLSPSFSHQSSFEARTPSHLPPRANKSPSPPHSSGGPRLSPASFPLVVPSFLNDSPGRVEHRRIDSDRDGRSRTGGGST